MMPWAAKHLTARVEEARGGRALLVGEHFGVGHPRAIVDGHVHVLPADPARVRPAVAVVPVPDAPDLPQRLHVEVDHGARPAPLVYS